MFWVLGCCGAVSEGRELVSGRVFETVESWSFRLQVALAKVGSMETG
jgi:hypothetical protein